MKHTLEITCNKDLSSMERSDGVESYEYHFLLKTKKSKIGINEFLKLMDVSTRLKWRYKELCVDTYFILISRIKEDVEFKRNEKGSIIFEIESDFVPKQSKYIKQV